MRKISRREFVRISTFTLAGALAACGPAPTPPSTEPEVPATPIPEQPVVPVDAEATGRYQEAPMLSALVGSGQLPSVDERLPAEPLMLDMVDEVGVYSDRWTYAEVGDQIGNLQMLNSNENFLKWTRDGTGFRNNLLTSYEWNDDATEVTMYMRKGIRWSDGEPLTFDDYIFWWEDMVNDPDVQYAPPAGYIFDDGRMELTKIDDYTVRAKFPRSNPLFLQFLARGTANMSSYMHVPPAHYMKTLHPKYTPGATVEELLRNYTQWYNTVDRPMFTPWVLREIRSGQGATLERNPYYWKVDPDGKQLPYFDRTEIRIVQDATAIQPLLIGGELDYQFRATGQVQDYSLLIENQASGDYTVDFWGCGNPAAAGILFYFNYKDEKFGELLWDQTFRRALSVAVDRNRINEIVYFGTGTVRQFAMPPTAPEFESPRGQDILHRWETEWAQHDPALAREMLDEIGVVDVSGDGWRDYPDGTPLECIIDTTVTSANDVAYIQLVSEDWERVGLKTVMNAIDGTILNERAMDGSSGLRARGGAASGLLIAPGHWTPIENASYVTIGAAYGLYFATGGQQGEKPPEGSFIEKLQQKYAAAVVEPDEAKRTELLLDAYEVCVDEGPTCLGFVGLTQNAVVRKNHMRNMTTQGETLCSWHYSQPNSTDPEQWFKV